MTPEQKVHRRQRRLTAGERHACGERQDVIDLAEELGVPQARRDALAQKKLIADQAAKDFHDEAAHACGDIGIQPLSGDDKPPIDPGP